MVLKPVPNERELLDSISRGDEKAFKYVFAAYGKPLFTFIVSILKCRSTSEEVLNDIFLKIWEQRSKLSTVNSLSGYIYILCRNYSLNALRTIQKNKKETVDIETLHEVNFSEFDKEQENPRLELLRNAINKLPQQQKKVLLLKHDGYKNEEVGSQMQLSTNSVKKYQKLAIDNLVKYLNFNR